MNIIFHLLLAIIIFHLLLIFPMNQTLIVISIFIATRCFGQETNLPTKQMLSCQICLISEEIDLLKKKQVEEIISGNDQRYIDSLSHIEQNLMEQLNSKIVDYSILYTIDSMVVKDSAFFFYINSYNFGTDLSNKKRLKIYQFLYDEILMWKSGHWIEEREYITDLKFKTYGSGQNITNYMGVEIIVTDINKWKEEKLSSWELWMNEINNQIVKLTNKNYFDLSEGEIFALKSQIKLSLLN